MSTQCGVSLCANALRRCLVPHCVLYIWYYKQYLSAAKCFSTGHTGVISDTVNCMDILHVNFTKTHPFDLFRQWLEKARESEINDPEAVALATASADGMPAVRMVLMKELDTTGFCFYTNMESNKGRDLAANPQAAMCFHWKSLGRQVRIQGRVQQLPPERADAYFATRHPQSRLGAWASQQSRALDSRDTLEARLEAAQAEYGEVNIPRPPYWGGYRIVPTSIEFWQAGEFRLHDRFVFTPDAHGVWTAQRLNP